MTLKQMKKCPKYYICKFSIIEVDWNAMLMWLNKSIATIYVMLKILDIMSLRFIYIFK